MEERQNPPAHGFVFDYDGTLLKSPRETMRALQAIARQKGLYVPSLRELCELWHLPWPEILWNVWADNANVISVLFEEEQRRKPQFDPHPWVNETLAGLTQRGLLLALVTNRDEESLCATAAAAGIRLDLFDVLDGTDGRKHHKPDPRAFNPVWSALKNTGIRRQNIYVVGDGIGDLEASQAFGFDFVAFPTYVTSATTFRKLGVPQSNIITDLRELARFA